MNNIKLTKLMAFTICSVTAGTLLIGTYCNTKLTEAEHTLEIRALKHELEVAHEVIEKQELDLCKLDEELESTYAAPIYNIPLDDTLQQYTYDMCNMYGIVDKYDIVLALMWRESDFKPDAISTTDDYGLMQINAVHFTTTFDVVNALDPKANIEYGVCILSDLYARYIDDNMALMAYNMGCSRAAAMWEKGTYASTYSLDILDKVKLIRTDQYYK